MDVRANLFLCAAPRSGSTQLAAWLQTHRDIELCRIKEPNFFSNQGFPRAAVARERLNDVDPDQYVSSRSRKSANFAIFRERWQYDYLFSHMTARLRVDASTSYLHSKHAPAAIMAYNDKAKVIILTRDPVERAVSHYCLARQTGRLKGSLDTEIANEIAGITAEHARFLIRPSLYAEALARYRAIIGPDSLLEISFEQMTQEPTEFWQRLSGFLDLDPTGFDLSRSEQNAGRLPRVPYLNRAIHKLGLKRAFRALAPEPLVKVAKSVLLQNPGTNTADKNRARRLLRHAIENEQSR